MVLSTTQIDQFINDGFVKLEGAFPRATASACRDILWRELGLSPDKPDDWKEPVMRLGMYAGPPFREAVSSPRLAAALDQLVGAGRWNPWQALGHMVVRFPRGAPWDDGWHLDASFPPPSDPTSLDFFQWRINYLSRDRAMLMLFLLSDCGPDDAPTRVRVASHFPMAQQLEAHGLDGASLMELAKEGFASSDHCGVALATGEAGTVWLLHPFTVHAAQAHRGTEPRFIAQPGLVPSTPLEIERKSGVYSPVETAIRLGLGRSR
ncbi:MAG: phytanoyl-CoA dioxygenase family protein [Hyphomonadaceae bacterium]